MAVITPVGKVDFDWVPRDPKEEMVKTASANDESAEASTEEKTEAKEVVKAKSDKDLLYEAAKKVVEAQFGDTEVEDEVEDEAEEVEDEAEEVEETGEEVEESAEAVEEANEAEAVGDVQEAVAELVEKANQADEVAAKVEEAVAKVEEAVAGVKEAVEGGAEAVGAVEEAIEAPEEAVIDIDVVDETPELGGEEIVIESEPEIESCGAMASSDKKDLQKLAGADDFVKISMISPTTKKKVLKFWKDDLGYVADYAKLMTTNFEK